MLKFYKKILSLLSKKSLLVTLLVVVFGVGLYGHSANAWDWFGVKSFSEGAVLTLFGWLFALISYPIGILLNVVISVLLGIASYDNFVNEVAINTGWTQVRDLSNMFFILILLVIAFATILRVESYNIKRQLPKLIIMAVLINFSKTICGLIIDFSQVIMMTFINTIDANGQGIINLFGVQNFLSYVDTHKFSGKVNFFSTVAGYFLALLFLIITLVTVLAFLSVLLMRIVMLWIYIVLSPLAYLLAAFPQGQSYASRWWSEFSKYVITGPVLAFFLWLALISAGTIPNIAGEDACYGPWDVVCTGPFTQFIIGIGMLLGGLKITSEIGGIVGGAAGNAFSNIKSGNVFVRTRKAGSWAGRKIAAKTGVELRPSQIIGGIKESFKEKEVKDNAMARSKAGALLEKGGARSLVGALGAGPDGANAFISGYGGIKGVKNAWRTLRNNPNKIETAKEEHQTEMDKRGNRGKTIEQNIVDIGNSRVRFSEKQEALKAEREKLEQHRKGTREYQNSYNDKMAAMAPPTAFEGRAAERSLLNDEKKKAAEFTTSEELVLNFKKAMTDGNTHRAIAVAEQLADNGDANELLTAHGYGTSAIDLHKFIQNEVKGKNGITEQEALRYQNYISTGAQKAGQWELAKTVKVGVDGKFESLIKEESDGSYNDDAHVLVAYSDMSKMDPQAMAKLGRLALGGEDERGDYQLSNLGKMIMSNYGHAFKDHEKRIQASTAEKIMSAGNIEEVLDDYRNVAVKDNQGNVTGNMKDEIVKALEGRFADTNKNFSQKLEEVKKV